MARQVYAQGRAQGKSHEEAAEEAGMVAGSLILASGGSLQEATAAASKAEWDLVPSVKKEESEAMHREEFLSSAFREGSEVSMPGQQRTGHRT